VFSVSSPSIIDTEATEDKKYGYEDEKKYGYEDEKKYGYDNKDKKYAYAEEEKYGKENKYGYEEDNKYGDDKKSVKYVSCENININGKSFKKHGDRGNHVNGYGEESSYPKQMNAYGEESSYPSHMNSYGEESSYGGSSYGGSSYGENSYVNHNSKPDYVKETHKDVTIICIQKNFDKKDRENKTAERCEDCFTARNLPAGIVPPGLLDDLREDLFAVFDVTSFTELCEALKDLEMTTTDFEEILNLILPGASNPPVIDRILDCLVLFDALIEDRTP
jgi:hypothetical protein